MRLEVLHVPGCPNLPLLLQRLAQASDVPVATHVVDSETDAVRLGMAGSPTLLIDGIDPFALPGQQECGLSCRLYRGGDGRIVGAPTVDQIREAISRVRPHGRWLDDE